MAELREFARHKAEFDAVHTDLIAIGPDDPGHAKQVWDGPANKSVQILMDPDYRIISAYGLKGLTGTKRSVVILDENGKEIYRQSTDGIDESQLPAKLLGILKSGKS